MDAAQDVSAAPPPSASEPSRGLSRLDSLLLTSSAVIYLAAACATTFITYRLGYEDWYLYALMSLCTATVVTNYAILKPRAPWWLRIVVWGFAELVIAAWSLLLFERTQVGWVIVDGNAVDHGAQGWFFVSVALNVLCGVLLTVHLLFVAPRIRRAVLAG